MKYIFSWVLRLWCVFFALVSITAAFTGEYDVSSHIGDIFFSSFLVSVFWTLANVTEREL